MKSNWTVSLFIGKRWRFGAGNRSCVSLPPGSASGSPAREWRNRARPFSFFFLCAMHVIVIVSMREREWERESVLGCVKAFYFLCKSLCPHACTEEGKPYLSEQHPHTLDPPLAHPSSSLSDTSSASINRDWERLTVLLLASDLQASLFPESSPQIREPMSGH